MAGINRLPSSPFQRSTQQSSGVSPNDATQNVRPEQNRPDAAAQTPPETAYTVRDGWENADAAVRPNQNPGMADVQLVQQTLPAEESAAPSNAIDWDFIGELEGKAEQNGYVPDADGSKSGVTVGTGVDLGARDSDDLARLGLSESLQQKLQPYLGLQRQDAVDALAENPLQLTAEEVEELDQAVKAQALDSLITTYNAEVADRNAADGGNRASFEELPPEMQTVIASVNFQYGSLPEPTPNFFNQVVDQNWGDALGNLRDFGDNYPTRRGLEADLLESAMGAPV